MDQNTAYQLFLATYHPSPEVHKQAETNIRNVESLEGFLPTVLCIQAEENYELGARQAAAIYFKNCIYSNWERESINANDKTAIRNNIFQVLMTAPPTAQIHLSASLHKILCVDFPDQWPSFMQELEKLLMSDQIRGVHVGLIGLYELIKVFQWKAAENREPLYNIVAVVFPVMQNICLKLLELESADILILALKIYHSSAHIELPPCFEDQMTHLVPWCSLFIKIVEKPITIPNGTVDFEKYVWWGTKKWAYRCLNLLMDKYSAQSNTSFIEGFAPNILTAYLQQLDGWMKKEVYISEKCLALSADFLCEAIKHKATWKIMKDYVDMLVSQFIFPLACFSTKDEMLWTENPADYVHRKNEIFEQSNIPQQNIALLLVDLIRNRKSQTFIPTLNFINSILSRDLSENGREKDGALYMIGALSPTILRSKSVRAMMESFFMNHVLPEFKSEFPFLRARACELVKRFEGLGFISEENLSHIYVQTLDCLRDHELPVQVQAVLALQQIVRNEKAREATGPHLAFIIQTLIGLMNQIDTDVLVTALEEFVETFNEQLSPYAVELCKQLSDTYVHLLEDFSSRENDVAVVGNEDAFNGKIVTAMSIIETIQRLISDPENSAETISKIEQAILPSIQLTIENRVYALYNEVFEMIAFCVLASQQVSQPMWAIFELCYKTFKEDGEGFQHYAGQMVPCLYSFVTLGKDVFISNEQARLAIFDIIDACLGSEELSENDRIPSCRLAEAMLLSCGGAIDDSILSFLTIAFRYISEEKFTNSNFTARCLEIAIGCIHYNPRLALEILEKSNWTQAFFPLWFTTMNQSSSLLDIKLNIVALCALLKLPTDQIPACLQSYWPQVLIGISLSFSNLSKLAEGDSDSELADDEDDGEEEEEEEEEETDDIDEDSGSEEEADSDCEDESGSEESDTEGHAEDEDVEDEDAEYLDFLSKEVIEDADDLNAVDNAVDESLYQSPLDGVNLYEYFEQSLKELQQLNPDLYNYLMKSLNEESLNTVVEILNVAEKGRSKD
ncbi:armadillo-type protein [Sporodiniella umbellata]|nr:armadillo-type protein [Sporodiniella umbellata]